ncbi:MAG: hypothetical protein RL704_41 [Pseudomonadota bacterium]
MGWTPEKTEQLKKLWNEGHTASQIAGMLGDGISRNAVIGKSHRLGLAGRSHSRNIYIQKSENKFHHKNSVPLKRLRKPRGLRAIIIEKDFEPENPTSLENLNEKTCRWPIGHPDEFTVNYTFFMLTSLKVGKMRRKIIKTQKEQQKSFQSFLKRKSNPLNLNI